MATAKRRTIEQSQYQWKIKVQQAGIPHRSIETASESRAAFITCSFNAFSNERSSIRMCHSSAGRKNLLTADED
jgi:hypothetical protein